MSPKELRDIRIYLSLSEADFATELGYAGSERNRAETIRKYESGKQTPIPTYIARLAYLLAVHVEVGGMPKWPLCCAHNAPKQPGVNPTNKNV